MTTTRERISVESPRDGDHLGSASIGVVPSRVAQELDALRAENERLRAELARLRA